MANTRCNAYSQGNRLYRNTDAGYWGSSADELATVDLPAMIDAVLAKTGQRQLAIVGHSQGAALPLMLMAARPEYNAKASRGGPSSPGPAQGPAACTRADAPPLRHIAPPPQTPPP